MDLYLAILEIKSKIKQTYYIVLVFLFRDVIQKINEVALAIKGLVINAEMKKAEIERLLNISSFQNEAQKEKKFNQFYVDKIARISKNKTIIKLLINFKNN